MREPMQACIYERSLHKTLNMVCYLEKQKPRRNWVSWVQIRASLSPSLSIICRKTTRASNWFKSHITATVFFIFLRTHSLGKYTMVTAVERKNLFTMCRVSNSAKARQGCEISQSLSRPWSKESQPHSRPFWLQQSDAKNRTIPFTYAFQYYKHLTTATTKRLSPRLSCNFFLVLYYHLPSTFRPALSLFLRPSRCFPFATQPQCWLPTPEFFFTAIAALSCTNFYMPSERQSSFLTASLPLSGQLGTLHTKKTRHILPSLLNAVSLACTAACHTHIF